MMPEFIRDWWPALVALVSGVFWLGRLESRANSNTREINGTRAEMIRLEERLAAQRAEDIASRHRDWSELRAELGEMRKDIKTLLSRQP